MSQKPNPYPVKYKCPNGLDYSPQRNVEKYQFQLRYSPLVNHTDKNPGSLCYIGDENNKFGEVGGCSNEEQLLNYTTPNIINQISNNNFTRTLFKYDKNYVSQPPFLNIEGNERMDELDSISEYDDSDLYKKYCMKKFKDSYSLQKINNKK